MKDLAIQSYENVGESNILLETVVAAHYLALQMRILAGGRDFNGRDAIEFLAAALSEWAALVESDGRMRQEWFGAPADAKRH